MHLRWIFAPRNKLTEKFALNKKIVHLIIKNQITFPWNNTLLGVKKSNNAVKTSIATENNTKRREYSIYIEWAICARKFMGGLTLVHLQCPSNCGSWFVSYLEWNIVERLRLVFIRAEIIFALWEKFEPFNFPENFVKSFHSCQRVPVN